MILEFKAVSAVSIRSSVDVYQIMSGVREGDSACIKCGGKGNNIMPRLLSLSCYVIISSLHGKFYKGKDEKNG